MAVGTYVIGSGVAPIEHYPWDAGGYRPRAEARMDRSDTHLLVRLTAWEIPVATYRAFQDPVWKDSCLECFLSANPGSDDRYLNFEMNAFGTLLLAVGPDRNRREPVAVESPAELFQIRPFRTAELWGVEFAIPWSLLERIYGRVAPVMAGNFYKCGDAAPRPHYGCWSPVDAPQPDFHRPDQFGRLIAE